MYGAPPEANFWRDPIEIHTCTETLTDSAYSMWFPQWLFPQVSSSVNATQSKCSLLLLSVCIPSLILPICLYIVSTNHKEWARLFYAETPVARKRAVRMNSRFLQAWTRATFSRCSQQAPYDEVHSGCHFQRAEQVAQYRNAEARP